MKWYGTGTVRVKGPSAAEGEGPSPRLVPKKPNLPPRDQSRGPLLWLLFYPQHSTTEQGKQNGRANYPFWHGSSAHGRGKLHDFSVYTVFINIATLYIRMHEFL